MTMTTKNSEHTKSELVEGLTKHVLNRLLGSVIVARVRASPTLRHVLIEALLLALTLGLVGNRLLGLPISVCFFATLALFGDAVLQVYFADAHKLYTTWTTFRRQSYLILGVLLGSRLLLGDALGVPTPAEVYADIQERGGFAETFWNHVPPDGALFEMCLDIPLAIASMAAVLKKSRKAWTFFVVIALFSIFLNVMPITRSAFHACIPVDGVIVCTLKLLFTGFGSAL